MQLVPSRAEYATILLLLLALVVSMFLDELRRLSRRPSFWSALATCVAFGLVFDIVALRLEWWSFSSGRLLGLSVLAVPIEELGLFALIFTLAVSAWES